MALHKRHELYRHRHVFELIDRPRRLVLSSTETRVDGSSFHTMLEFTFEASEGKTLMTMIQKGFPTIELRDEHERPPQRLRTLGETRPGARASELTLEPRASSR